VLVRYCVVWADWLELNRLLQQSGKLLKGARGHFVRNPLWFMRRDAEQVLADLARQLGLTPSSRLRMGVAHVVPEDEKPQGIAAMSEQETERWRRLVDAD
jgi:P27 family predicted phage terminase small subunit